MGKPKTDSESSSITHFSHPHHLQQLNHQSMQGSTIVSCSCCHLEASEKVYGCVSCNFFLHKKCSELPKQITHPFDQGHVLYLLPKPKYPEGKFSCDACGKHGHGFSYHCETCGKDLHTNCASLPMLLTHQSHYHQLSLTFSPPYHKKTFSCDICKKKGSKCWLYRCASCEFDVHLSCVTMQANAPRSTLPTNSPSPASYPGIVTGADPTAFTFMPPMQNPLSQNFINNQPPVGHGSVLPIGIGQVQPPAMGMRYTVKPTNTVPANNFTSSTPQQVAIVQHQAFMQQIAFPQQQPIMQQPLAPRNMLMNSFVEGIASGASQAAMGAIIQGMFGGDGGNEVAGVDSLGGGSGGGADGGGGGDETY